MDDIRSVAMSAALEPTEEEFKAAVIDMLRLHGFQLLCHFRPARTNKGWATPIEGDPGFPDIAAVSERAGVAVFLELKSTNGKPGPGQQEWVDALHAVPGVYADIVWPHEWDLLEARIKELVA